MLNGLLDGQCDAQARHIDAQHPLADRWIVERGGEAIGRFDVDRTTGPWRLIEIALVPSARGAGIGTALLAWLIGEAGVTGVELHVAHDNPRAAALYARTGFVRVPGMSATHERMVRPFS